MSSQNDATKTGIDLEDLVASSDTGSRNPIGPVGVFLAGFALERRKLVNEPARPVEPNAAPRYESAWRVRAC